MTFTEETLTAEIARMRLRGKKLLKFTRGGGNHFSAADPVGQITLEKGCIRYCFGGPHQPTQDTARAGFVTQIALHRLQPYYDPR